MKGVKKFYTRDALDKLMFGHVNALVKEMPFTTKQALLNFMKEYKLSSDEYSLEVLETTFFRIKKEFSEV